MFERFEEIDAIVSEPIGDNAPYEYDIVAGTPDGFVKRFVLRVAQFKDGRIFFQADTDSDEEKVDHYLLYGSDLEQLFLVNSAMVDSSITLRVEAPKQVRKPSLRAEDYESERQWPPSSGSRVPRTTLMGIGIEALRDLGVEVAYPADQDSPCDVLVGSTDGRFLRVAIEPGWISNGRIRSKPETTSGIDYFLLVCRALETCYLVDAEEFDVSISLRVEPPKHDPGTIHYAEEYERTERWPIE